MKKHIPFPINQFVPKKIHVETMSKLRDFGITTKEQAYVIARDCYTALNTKLQSSKHPYFFGARPSALDVAVFGHIVDAMGNSQLAQTVVQHAPLLVTLSERIRDTYFVNGPKPTSLASPANQSCYTENQANYFASLDSSWMQKASPSVQVSFLEPYKSLNWGRRELVGEVAKKREEQEKESESKGYFSAVEGFEKGTRNVIIGALAMIFVYAVARLPLQFSFVGDDDDDEDMEDDDE